MLGSMHRTGPADHCVSAAAVEGCVLHGLWLGSCSGQDQDSLHEGGKSVPPVVGPSLKVQDLEQLM